MALTLAELIDSAPAAFNRPPPLCITSLLPAPLSA